MNILLNNKLNRRLRPLFIASFLVNFVMWYAIEKLYMQHIGLDATAITLLIALFVGFQVLTNVPFGVLADRWSRKHVLAIGYAAMIVGCGLAILSHSLLQYAAADACFALFFACEDGAYDAVIYDLLLEETGSADQYENYYGRGEIIKSVALVVSSLVGGAVAEHLGLRLTYALTIPPFLLGIVSLYFFREPLLHKQASAPLLRAHIGEMLSLVLNNNRVRWIVATMALSLIATEIILELDQLWLLAFAVPALAYGPVNALLLSGFGFGGYVAGKMKSWQAGMRYSLAILIICGFGLVVRSLGVTIAAQAGYLTVATTCYIILSRQLHDALPSRIRNGSSSLVNSLGVLLFIPVSLAFGVITQHSSVFKAAWIPVVVALLLGGGMLHVFTSKSESQTS